MQLVIPKRELQLECALHYDPENVMYTVNATWNLTNQHPLVLEALLAHEFRVNGLEFEHRAEPFGREMINIIPPQV